MKKLSLLLATATVALMPLSTFAVSYEPTYTCQFRDIGGHCMNYVPGSMYNMYNPVAPRPYGNRMSITYPFNGMVNAWNTNQYRNDTWNNRTTNPYNFPAYFNRFENPYDNNDYFDSKDPLIRQYYDTSDFQYRTYQMQHGNNWQNDGYRYGPSNNNGTYRYEHTSVTCSGWNCPR